MVIWYVLIRTPLKLKVVLWEMMELKVPYTETLSYEVVKSQVCSGQLSLSQPTGINAPELCALIFECTELNPEKRPHSFQVFIK
jgi:hypothetical protein